MVGVTLDLHANLGEEFLAALHHAGILVSPSLPSSCLSSTPPSQVSYQPLYPHSSLPALWAAPAEVDAESSTGTSTNGDTLET